MFFFTAGADWRNPGHFHEKINLSGSVFQIGFSQDF